jgi:putative Holliday junction resolvase
VKPPTRLLGIDSGKARIGLAISDPDRRIASPLQTWNRRDLAQDGRFLQKVIAEEEIGLIVLGLPMHLNGSEGEQAKAARAFGKWLAERTTTPIVFWDERFTTREAESALWDAGLTHKQRKERRDQVAAQILLQTFIDAGCPLEAKFEGIDGIDPEIAGD